MPLIGDLLTDFNKVLAINTSINNMRVVLQIM